MDAYSRVVRKYTLASSKLRQRLYAYPGVYTTIVKLSEPTPSMVVKQINEAIGKSELDRTVCVVSAVTLDLLETGGRRVVLGCTLNELSGVCHPDESMHMIIDVYSVNPLVFVDIAGFVGRFTKKVQETLIA